MSTNNKNFHICPKCGNNYRILTGKYTFDNCHFCGCKMIETDITRDDINRFKGQEYLKQIESIRDRFTRNSNKYDSEMERKRIEYINNVVLENFKHKLSPRIVNCPRCNAEAYSSDETCNNCGQPIASIIWQNPGQFPAFQEEISALRERWKSQQPNVPRCPTCQSTNVSKISDLSRGMSVFAFGLFSSKIGKTMECKSCGYKW